MSGAAVSGRTDALVFGEVADTYEQIRPGYPVAAFDRIARFGELRPCARVVEVGAGTGKATTHLARRGWRVEAIEPSPEMAAVAAERLIDVPAVRVSVVSFEDWAPPAEPCSAIVSAAAWHWVDPRVGYPKARRVLADDGVLALLWNRPRWHDVDLVAELRGVYQRLAPALAYAPMPMMRPDSVDGERFEEIDGSGYFAVASVEDFDVDRTFSATDVVTLLRTQSYHQMLDPRLAAELEGHVVTAIARRGPTTDVTYTTRLYLARPTTSAPR